MSWILIVEDEEEITNFLRYVLEGDNYRVETATTLAEARERLNVGLPVAILLDRGLPDGDGLELCQYLKQYKKPRPPVLVLSARKDSDAIREGMEAGAVEYITKPFQFVSVLSRVRALTACA